MKAILICNLGLLLLCFSCTKKGNERETIAETPVEVPLEKEVNPQPETISYKAKARPELVKIIEYYERIIALHPSALQLIDVSGANAQEKVNFAVRETTPVKIDVVRIAGDHTIHTEYYLKDQYLSFVKEVEIVNPDSIVREDHFYFDHNELLKKVPDHDYDAVVSKKELQHDQDRMKNALSEYSTLMLNELVKIIK